MKTKNTILLSAVGVLGLCLVGTGCNSNNNQSMSSPWDVTPQSNNVGPSDMVNTLVQEAKNGTIDPAFKGSYLAKLGSETPGYYVIWDSARQGYVAINLNCNGSCYNAATIVKDYVGANAGQSGSFVTGTVQYNSITLENRNNSGNFVNVTPTGVNSQGQTVYHDGVGGAYSRGDETKDVDLQRASLQSDGLSEAAAAVSAHFQMDFEHAQALVTLADRIKQSSTLTAEDQSAVLSAAFSIAGITQAEVGQAVAEKMKGNASTADQLIEKAAHNLGMPTSKVLRDQILPILGVHLND